MRDKIRRLRGTRTQGRGYKGHRSGARGGVGRAGLEDHKRTTGILLARKALIRASTCIRDIESKLDRYVKKKIAIYDQKLNSYDFPCGLLCKKYNKVLSTGEPSGSYHFCRHLKLSKTTKYKLGV